MTAAERDSRLSPVRAGLVLRQIPVELTGRYLRNAPNPLGLDDPTVAIVHLPARVPLGFHGSWIPDR